MSKAYDDFTGAPTKDFFEVAVGDLITVSRNGKTYSHVQVKGESRRRWVSARKVGMRWQPRGVGITQLQIEGYILNEVKQPKTNVANDSRFDVDSVIPSAENIGFFSGFFAGRESRREKSSSEGLFSSSSKSSSSGDGFFSSLGDLFN